MTAFKQSKNLLQERDTYNRYYGDFRGVDFSSDHTQVHEQRLAYVTNMFKDYQSGQGQALETIVGFRKRFVLPEEKEIFGIFHFQHKENNKTVTKVFNAIPNTNIIDNIYTQIIKTIILDKFPLNT